VKDPAVQKVQQEVNPENVWADNNPAEVQHTVDKYLNENPNASRNPGTRRHVVCSEFKKLPDQERLTWSSKAVEV
jgi:hypothetical protein